MEPLDGFGDRLQRAWLSLQARQGRRMQYAELGGLVSAFLGREEPYSPGAVSRWFTGAVPDLDTICALACTLGEDPAALAFGTWADRQVAITAAAAERERKASQPA